ncbi:unnamed protein product [Linum trigynum]|uniref:Glycosyltransferase 61 catalytic domain-containing protein n=1 Tax=Linum trigynum TaxID=586398 RepID=A0AAV2EWH2_9ROSI
MDETKASSKMFTKAKASSHLPSIRIISTALVLLLLLLLTLSHFYSSASPSYLFRKWQVVPSSTNDDLTSKLRDSVTFLPLKDLRFSKTAMEGNTWFMSSLTDTREVNESEYLYFPSQASKGRILCIQGRNDKDGTKNSYALAWPEALPEAAKLTKGLTFVSDSYYDYVNLWHGLTAMAPFVGWSMKNGCLRPSRWVLFHWGERRGKMGSWLEKLMAVNFGEVKIEGFEGDDEGGKAQCFEKAVVMRHNVGSMGKEKELQVFEQLRCRARRYCGLNPAGKGRREVDDASIRLTLLLRRGSRSFKNARAVTDVFAKECAEVKGCVLKVVQSEELTTFCDQVRTMTETDIVASPHGAQLTNMLFMDRGSSVMEFFPKGWFELAGIGQYVFHWMADQSGLIHQGAWWEPMAKKECPSPDNELECFFFYKDGQVGHNETYFGEWARRVLNQVRDKKVEDHGKRMKIKAESNACTC